MKKIFLIMGVSSAFLAVPGAFAQSIGPSTLNATGGTKTVGSYVYDWSVGELTMVATYYGSNVVVTQGVLQNEISIPEGVSTATLSHNLQVFPNPASSVVNLQFNSTSGGTLSYRLMDVAGRIIVAKTITITPGPLQEKIDITDLAVATYMLQVTFKTATAAEESTTYKIEKLK